MNYDTARRFLIAQGTALQRRQNPDAFLCALERGEAPLPGQMTNLLLAVKTVFTDTREQDRLERELVAALHQLALDSFACFEAGRRRGVKWPPLLAEDLQRLRGAIASVFEGEWRG